jgi:uncharacterized membrane protein
MARQDLIALGYARVSVARRAAKTLRDMADEGVLALEDVAVVVKRDDGRVEIQQGESLSAGDGLISGGTIGLLIGLPLGLPIAAAVIGVLGGGAFSLRDSGVSDTEMRRFGEELQTGHGAVFALVSQPDWSLLRARLQPYDGEVVTSEVSAEVVAGLDP